MGLLVPAIVMAALGAVLVLHLVEHRRRPDDTHALQLAAELGTGSPVYLAEHGWCISLDTRTSIQVHEYNVIVRRTLVAPGRCTILSAPLQGRSQEDYLGGQMLVPGPSGWMVGGNLREVREWERQIPLSLPARMEALGVRAIVVEEVAAWASCGLSAGASQVRATKGLLALLDRKLS